MASAPYPDPTFQLPMIRAIVSDLIHDEGLEDEVTQEVLIAAWRHPPWGGRSPRSWIRRVTRNFLLQRLRERESRRRREAAASVPDRTEATVDLLEAQELRKRVGQECLRLEEPYRATLILRYVEGKSARDIAGSQGIAVETVRWRTRKAIGILRNRLGLRDPKERARWQAVLWLWGFPAARRRLDHPRGTHSSDASSGVALRRFALAFVGMAAVAVFVQWMSKETPVSEPPRLSAVALASSPEFVSTTTNLDGVRQTTLDRWQTLPGRDPLETPAEIEEERLPVQGRIVTVTGDPVSGAKVFFEPRPRDTALESLQTFGMLQNPIAPHLNGGRFVAGALALRPIALTDAKGQFCFSIPEAVESGALAAKHGEHGMVHRRGIQVRGAMDLGVLALSGGHPVGGVVVGENAAPLRSAMVVLHAQSFDQTWDSPVARAFTDEAGRFSFPPIPAKAVRVVVSANNHEILTVSGEDAPELLNRCATIVLKPTPMIQGALRVAGMSLREFETACRAYFQQGGVQAGEPSLRVWFSDRDPRCERVPATFLGAARIDLDQQAYRAWSRGAEVRYVAAVIGRWVVDAAPVGDGPWPTLEIGPEVISKMERGVRLEVRVKHHETDQPIHEFGLQAKQVADNSFTSFMVWPTQTVYSNEQGVAVVEGLLPGEYDITVSSPGRLDVNQRVQVGMGGSSVTSTVVGLSMGRSLVTVAVRDWQGNPVLDADAQIHLRGETPHSARHRVPMANRQGEYLFRSVLPGKHLLRVVHEPADCPWGSTTVAHLAFEAVGGFFPTYVEVTLPRSEPVRFVPRDGKNGSLALRVVDDQWRTLRDDFTTGRRQLNGTVHGAFPPGQYTAILSHSDGRSAMVPFRVPASAPVEFVWAER